MSFRATGPDTGATTPARAVGLSAEPQFRFMAAPAGEIEWLEDDETLAEQDHLCARLDPTDWSFFSAKNEDAALAAGSIIAMIPAQLSSGNLTPTCDLIPKVTVAECRERAARLRVQDIDDVGTCDPVALLAPRGACTSIYTKDLAVRVETTLVPGRGLAILELKLSELLIIADAVID